jgi:phosphohistidine phosphatase
VPLVLDLLRHGEAHPSDASGDAMRPLAEAGIRALRGLAAQLREQGWRPERVFASPLRRAVESAQIVIVELPVTIETMAALSPDQEPEDVLSALAEAGVDSGHALLVGHQPLLGRLVARLTGTGEASFAPASLFRIECDGAPRARAGRLLLELRPET